MVPLLDRLAVEVSGKLRERLRVVRDGDRNVLLRGRELLADLLVEHVSKRHDRTDSNDSRSKPK